MIWDHPLAELEDFVTRLNSYHQTINSHTVSDTYLSFLDVNVTKNENSLSTDIHIKPTDVHQYLHFSSCHPKKRQNGTEDSYLMMTASMDHFRNLVNTFKIDIT